jgi:lipopolysaccharide export system protein LptA
VARQEDLYIFSDMVEAHMSEASNEIEKAHAKGNVKLVKKERTATCNEAIFDNKKGEIILKGNVVVYSGQDKLTGDVVTYYVNEDRVVVEGEKQGEKQKKARMTITPK